MKLELSEHEVEVVMCALPQYIRHGEELLENARLSEHTDCKAEIREYNRIAKELLKKIYAGSEP